MIYKAVVVEYAPKAKKMAAAVEKRANEMAEEGWELKAFSVTNSAKAILVFGSNDTEKNAPGADLIAETEAGGE